MPNFEKINLSKEMFSEAKEKGLTLTELLSKNEKFQKGTKLSALGQQLATRNLSLAGAHAALVDDFFKTEDNRILFVETINEMVRTGMDEELKSFATLTDITATRTGIAGTLYQSAAVDIENSTAGASRVSEGAEFPAVTIKFKDKAIKLFKTGYKINATYESIRRMKINVFGVAMKVIGRNITRQKVANAIDVLINGDGNGNPIKTINAITSGTLTYADTINLAEEFVYFEPSMLISGKDMRIAYLNLPEYKDKNGPSMMEAPKKCNAIPIKRIIAMDAKACLEEIYEKGGSLVEYDKIITKQVESAVVSEVSGFGKIFPEAAVMLNV